MNDPVGGGAPSGHPQVRSRTRHELLVRTGDRPERCRTGDQIGDQRTEVGGGNGLHPDASVP